MNDVFEIIHTTRAMRRLKPDPVPDDLIRKILEAGVCAANGGNYQRWRFMVVTDLEVKKSVHTWTPSGAMREGARPRPGLAAVG